MQLTDHEHHWPDCPYVFHWLKKPLGAHLKGPKATSVNKPNGRKTGTIAAENPFPAALPDGKLLKDLVSRAGLEPERVIE
jgi:hypothetical protein